MLLHTWPIRINAWCGSCITWVLLTTLLGAALELEAAEVGLPDNSSEGGIGKYQSNNA